ncbi:MAG: hypothetical protein PWP52_388 [Bacteroidales bacterium]|nr:hypothetical protein [Bacteroidales bacterium]
MIFEYLNHPYVRYNEKRLYSEYLPILGKIVRKYAPSLFKIYLKILSHKIKVRKLLNIPGEKISIAESYDLVVMINVIEHCFDVEELFDKILKITNKGSYFIFEDKLIKNNDIKDAVDNTYDAAHPLKVEENVVLSFLENNFYLIYKRIQTSSNFYADESHFSDDIYFIGKKK